MSTLGPLPSVLIMEAYLFSRVLTLTNRFHCTHTSLGASRLKIKYISKYLSTSTLKPSQLQVQHLIPTKYLSTIQILHTALKYKYISLHCIFLVVCMIASDKINCSIFCQWAETPLRLPHTIIVNKHIEVQ